MLLLFLGPDGPRSFAAAFELDPSKCYTLGAAAYVPHCSRGSTPEQSCTSWTLQSPLGLPKMGDPEIIQNCHFQQGNRWFWGIDKIIDILGHTQFVQTDSMCRVPHTWKLNSMKQVCCEAFLCFWGKWNEEDTARAFIPIRKCPEKWPEALPSGELT